MEEHKLKAGYFLAAILRDANQSEGYDLSDRDFEACRLHNLLKNSCTPYRQTFDQLAEHIASMNENGSAQKLSAAYDREGFPATLQKVWLTALYLKPLLHANTLLDRLLGEAMPYLTVRDQFYPSDVPNTRKLLSRELGK